MSINIINIRGGQAGMAEGALHSPKSTIAIRGRCGHMVGIP